MILFLLILAAWISGYLIGTTRTHRKSWVKGFLAGLNAEEPTPRKTIRNITKSPREPKKS